MKTNHERANIVYAVLLSATAVVAHDMGMRDRDAVQMQTSCNRKNKLVPGTEDHDGYDLHARRESNVSSVLILSGITTKD